MVALLRNVYAKRERLSVREREMIHSFLGQVQKRTLTPPQIEAAKAIGRSLGVGYDDPTLDEPAAPQPWGTLPLKPPGRA